VAAIAAVIGSRLRSVDRHGPRSQRARRHGGRARAADAERQQKTTTLQIGNDGRDSLQVR